MMNDLDGHLKISIVLVLVIIFQSCVAVFGQVGHVLHPFVQLTSSLRGQWQHYISIFAL